MPAAAVVRLVELCIRRPWWTIVLAFALGIGASVYAARHFAIHTDVRDLLSPDLPWAQRAFQYSKQFPEHGILVVLDAPTAEYAEQAADKFAQALAAHTVHFRAVGHPGSGSFFEQNGLLFLPTDEVKITMKAPERAATLEPEGWSDPASYLTLVMPLRLVD